MNILDFFANSKVLDHHSAPGLMTAIESLAAKAGTSMPTVRLSKFNIPNALYHPVTHNLFLTNGILKLLDSQSMHQPPSRELNAILAHEMGHVKFRTQQFGSMFLLIGGLPIAALGALYLFDKTNEKVKQANASEADHPKAFWDAFSEVLADHKQKGTWQSWKDFSTHMNPIGDKLGINFIYGDKSNHRDLSWNQVLMEESKKIAVQAAALVPALAACRPISIANEFQCDRYAVALTGNTRDVIDGFEKLRSYSRGIVSSHAKTPLQRSGAERIMQAISNVMDNTLMAHPSLKERITILKTLNPQEVARSFHL